MFFFFFFQAEDGIRDLIVTGVQTCALPILTRIGGFMLRTNPQGELKLHPAPPSSSRSKPLRHKLAKPASSRRLVKGPPDGRTTRDQYHDRVTTDRVRARAPVTLAAQVHVPSAPPATPQDSHPGKAHRGANALVSAGRDAYPRHLRRPPPRRLPRRPPDPARISRVI